MIPAENFLTRSLRAFPDGPAVARILSAAVNAVDPGEAVRRFVHRDGATLTVAGQAYDLSGFRRICLLGIGKASVGMSEALAGILGGQLSEGLVVTKHVPASPPASFRVVPGGHPIPDENSLEAGEKTRELLSGLGPQDLLVCLISGGGSALVTSPVDSVSLADLQALTGLLLACGADIQESNALRRRLDRLKGGGVVRLANGATVVSLILSDVIGNPLEAIASGPTAPDPTTGAVAIAILEKYLLDQKAPASILKNLQSLPETPKPGDPAFEKVQNVLVGSNLQAAQAALRQAQEEGFNPYLLRTDLQGEAREAAFELATSLRQAHRTATPVPAPGCIVVGGETTVTLHGNGKGGRNTELALAAVSELADFPGVLLATLATDGEDGSTDAAGAVVTGESHHYAAGLGLHAGNFLARNDSYTYFAQLEDLLKPGPTGTNVNDLVFMFTF
ncbi:MAG TPA: DUF4147 domain-containing protein [Anaerolineales bacterium]|nr:DUF4147 domain-containing protein [Anaerolineales bacterium]